MFNVELRQTIVNLRQKMFFRFMSLAVCNSVRSVGLDGWVAGMLACQDTQTDKDTLARRAANG